MLYELYEVPQLYEIIKNIYKICDINSSQISAQMLKLY